MPCDINKLHCAICTVIQAICPCIWQVNQNTVIKENQWETISSDDDAEHEAVDTDYKCFGDKCLIKGEPRKSCVELLEKGK